MKPCSKICWGFFARWPDGGNVDGQIPNGQRAVAWIFQVNVPIERRAVGAERLHDPQGAVGVGEGIFERVGFRGDGELETVSVCDPIAARRFVMHCEGQRLPWPSHLRRRKGHPCCPGWRCRAHRRRSAASLYPPHPTRRGGRSAARHHRVPATAARRSEAWAWSLGCHYGAAGPFCQVREKGACPSKLNMMVGRRPWKEAVESERPATTAARRRQTKWLPRLRTATPLAENHKWTQGHKPRQKPG